MEASALKYQAGIGLHAKSPLLRLQSDERLITLLRRGNTGAFEVLFSRYETRLLSFCRHLLGSREDAEDVLQEVMTAAFNAIVADSRPINVRPWLYRIARNRSLNHLRKAQAIGVDSMDHHLAEHGATVADKVHEREEFRLLVGDIQGLPETQRTALVLREMDALSYEQIAEAMETTVSSVKSLLVRARVGLAEAAEARLLSCEQVRTELAEVAEGLQRKPSPLVRRHLKDCSRCAGFRTQLKATNKALAALLPVGPLVVIRKLAFLHLGHSAGASAGSTATAAGSTAGAGAASAGAGAAIGASGVFGGGSVVSAGMGAVATKAAAGLAAAVIVTAGAVEADHQVAHHPAAPIASAPESHPASPIAPVKSFGEKPSTVAAVTHRPTHHAVAAHRTVRHAAASHPAATTTTETHPTPVTTTTTQTTAPAPTTTATTSRVQTQTDPTVLPPTTTTAAPPIGTPTTPAPVTTTTTPSTTGTGTTTTPGTTGTGTTTTPGTTSTGTTTTPGTTSTGTTTTTGSATVPTTTTTSSATP